MYAANFMCDMQKACQAMQQALYMSQQEVTALSSFAYVPLSPCSWS